jgi:hypothetical protein
MPGFADKLTDDQRWDLINFVLARAAGDLTNALGPQITTTSTPPVPDFAFERNGLQNVLSQTLKAGPVLLVLIESPTRLARLAQLARFEPRLTAAHVHVIAVALGGPTQQVAPLVGVSEDVRTMLALFRSRADGGETELMLDRNASVRARWTASRAGGLPDIGTLLADAASVARTPVAATNHAGHAN